MQIIGMELVDTSFTLSIRTLRGWVVHGLTDGQYTPIAYAPAPTLPPALRASTCSP